MHRYHVQILDCDSSGIISAGRGSPRHYIAQRGSDADENSGQDRMQPGFCANRCECPADYDVVRKEISQHRERHRPAACLYSPYSIGFIRGHCGKVANKAPPGREIGASAQAAILSQPRADPTKAVHSQYQAAPCSLPSLAGVCLHTTASACGDGLRPLFRCAHSQSTQVSPACFKGGVTTLKLRPFSGTLDCAEPYLNRGIPALPLTRHCQVVLGVVPHDRSAKRTCQPRLSGGQKH